ncbi:hypothetical protein CBL_07504 [Carabus blaptoides fortunei]
MGIKLIITNSERDRAEDTEATVKCEKKSGIYQSSHTVYVREKEQKEHSCGSTNETVVRIQHVVMVVVRGLVTGAANLIKVTHIHFRLKTKTAKKYFSDYSLSPCFNARLFYEPTSEENELFDTDHQCYTH